MSSKRRLRRKACDGKVKHATLLAARIACRRTKSDSRDSLGLYRCKHCGFYHVGHRRGSRYAVKLALFQ